MTKKYTYPISLIIACITLVVVSGLFVTKYLTMKGRGDFKGHRSQRPPLEINNLQGWMTFDYINHSFRIPESNLKNELKITDKTYPKITIRKAASLLGIPTEEFITITGKAIESYLRNPSSPQK